MYSRRSKNSPTGSSICAGNRTGPDDRVDGRRIILGYIPRCRPAGAAAQCGAASAHTDRFRESRHALGRSPIPLLRRLDCIAAEPLLLENQINDAAFLRRVMPPVWRKQLEAWERRGELRYEHGGGLPIMKAMVEFFCQDDHARLAFGLPAALWRLVHFLIYDHDGDRAETPGEGSSLLEGACDRAGMKNHHYRLKRRNQENYLPIRAVRQIVDKEISDPTNHKRLTEKIDAYAAMGKEKHFENLESYLKAFKNAFATAIPSASSWPDDWFEDDDVWPEMTDLAERIASAM